MEQSINCILDNAKSTSPITSPTGGLDDDDNEDTKEKEVTEEKVADVKTEGELVESNNSDGGDSTSTPSKNVGKQESDTCDSSSKTCHKEIADDENVTSLVYQLLVEYNLIGKILDAYQQSVDKKSISKPSYLGHIIKIANHILSTKDVTVVKSCLDQLPSETQEAWAKWTVETLEDINSKMRSPLVSEPSDLENNYYSDDAMVNQIQATVKVDN